MCSLQLEGLAQTWWDTKQYNTTFVVELGTTPGTSSSTNIRNWAQLSDTLRTRFYPPGYVQSLWMRWHQIRQLPSQIIQGYIDFFYKL